MDLRTLEIFGHEFLFDGEVLSEYKSISRSKASRYSKKKYNQWPDPIFVRCESCNELMDYKDKVWTCTKCGVTVIEDEVYSELAKDVIDF